MKNKVVLKNTTLENVMGYLLEKAKGMSGKLATQTFKDGTISRYLLQNPKYSYPINKIEIDYTATIAPQGNEEKTQAYWGGLNAMCFEGMQLQTNTVKIKAECNSDTFLSDFEHCWDEMLKDFGADTNTQSIEATTQAAQPVIAKSQGKLKKWEDLQDNTRKRYEEYYSLYLELCNIYKREYEEGRTTRATPSLTEWSNYIVEKNDNKAKGIDPKTLAKILQYAEEKKIKSRQKKKR